MLDFMYKILMECTGLISNDNNEEKCSFNCCNSCKEQVLKFRLIIIRGTIE